MKPLNQETIRSKLTDSHGFYFSNIEVVAEIDSTNDELKRRAALGIKIDGHALVAELQTAGRGRNEKHWFSPPVGNIYLSVGVKMPIAESLSGFSLAIGVAVAQSLQLDNLKLKWPNDIYLEGCKLGGILIESTAPSECIVGIGINVAMQPGDVTDADGIDQPWTSLETAMGGEVDRDDLLVQLLEQVSTAIFKFRASRLQSFMKEWERMDMVRGKRVRLTLGSGQQIEGEACGIDTGGALQIDTGSTIKSFISGELRLL